MRTITGAMGEGRDGPGLTPLRSKIIMFIGESLRSRGYPPSLREIGDAVGLASTSSVAYQMSVLEATGYVNREPGRPRTAVPRLPGQDDAGQGAPAPGQGRTADVPLVGRIAAGVPVIADRLAELAEDVVCLPRTLTGEGSLIALRVAGDSMTGAAIADGDLVVVRQQPDADNGDIVAAILRSDSSDDWEATVKTLKKAAGHTWLLPHNPAYTPILADAAVIIGKVVSVLRRLLPPRRGPADKAATRPRGQRGRAGCRRKYGAPGKSPGSARRPAASRCAPPVCASRSSVGTIRPPELLPACHDLCTTRAARDAAVRRAAGDAATSGSQGGPHTTSPFHRLGHQSLPPQFGSGPKPRTVPAPASARDAWNALHDLLP